ncbi:MAG TPA: SDR family NAD(P)-dependent oxidoreductase [Thermoanaerobaculia bacterium]|nr:SDR family NAD(P)-dependent oxidoreductase [Thermoanaerobaculia bacterium]
MTAKTLLVTGASGGLGTAVLQRLGRDYRCVALIHSHPLPGVESITDPDQLQGEVFGIVHLAGGFTAGSSPDDFARMMEMNLMSAVRTIEPLRKRIEAGGRIVAVSSIASLSRPAGLAAYTAAKAALNAYIEVLAKELRPRRITANALLPSALATPAMLQSTEPLVPLEHIAETIAFLLREAAASISGQLLSLTA